MSALKIKLNPDFTDGVDRKLLRVVRDRFLQVNANRFERCCEGLSPRHQDILLVLPLLYHVNHPLLPGYVDKDTPFGVSNFEPDKSCLSIARSFSQTFTFKKAGKRKAGVHAIYMMGSTGTLAHSESSDVDLWLCHDPDLSDAQRENLSLKAQKIDEWANNLGLELHTFLMDPVSFKKGLSAGPADKESSGSAQHYLLLDEFYRTAILLAGRYPVWWLVPPEKESEYDAIVDLFLSKRFLKSSEVIDFGSASQIPKSELIGAGLWQLYKGLDSPYKSVLKILLAEVYAQELPEADTLSQVFKQSVYDDELSVERLDPYLLVYKRLESYLIKRREHKRLDIVQKSFYIKVAKKLSRKPSSSRGASWQRILLEKLVRKWGWPEDKFRYLDSRNSWKVDQVSQERQALVAELSFSYRFLSQYARAHRIRSSITAEDLNLLGRKLYAIFQKKAGKIERVNPGIVNSLWEENISLHHSSSQVISLNDDAWLVYRDLGTDSDAAFEVPIKKSVQLIELLAWLYFNGILNSATRLSLLPGESQLNLNELQNVVRALESSSPVPLPALPQENYQSRAIVNRVLLFVNLGIDPMDALGENGVHVLSDRTDALDYSSERINLVRSIDQICINSWNEVTAHRYDAGETILQCLQSYLQMCLEHDSEHACQLEVFCFCPQRAAAIAERVSDLFESVRKVFINEDGLRAGRYVLEIGRKFYIIQCIDEQFRFFSLENEAELFKTLMHSQSVFSPIYVDDRALVHESLLRSMLPLNLNGVIQVFYFSNKELYQLIVLDEYGSAQRLLMPRYEEEVLQTMVNECAQRMLESRQLSDGLPDVADIQVQLNRVVKKRDGQYQARAISKFNHCAIADVMLVDIGTSVTTQYDLVYQGVEFSHQEYGAQQFDALVHYVYKQAQQSDRIPLVIAEVISDSLHQLSGSYSSHKNRTQESFRLMASAQRKLEMALQRLH